MNEPLVIQLSRQWHSWVAKFGSHGMLTMCPSVTPLGLTLGSD